ncbi:DUF2573 family protein [Bacillus sp. HMF5848]|uniref:DUF2573 family protein n=1 Tax=Bacillus sp. HMF5848 TaxID=2495421 RepID=UPI000F793DC1|nr:DUF2573 family protein [Bacillus sp. HMF5848]RSK28475.1 DUF2573 family protein [Bacillus sp. HMF5848]
MDEKLDALLEKYTELMVGDTTEELKQKLEVYALYSHIAKSMPPLVKHWHELYPDTKEEMKRLFHEIKQMNEAHRNKE